MTDKDETTEFDFLTVKEAAEMLRINIKTMYRLVEKRKVPAKKVGAQWRLSRSRLEEFIGVPKSKG